MYLYDTGNNQHESPEDKTGNLLIKSLLEREKFENHDRFIVVLTSGYEETLTSISEDGLFSSYTGYQRYFAAQKLYHEYVAQGEKPLIILSGGTIRIGDIDHAPSLSEIMERELITFHGIDKEDIFKEELSRDTYENAKYVLGVLKMNNINDITLITSANHLRRAMYIFSKLDSRININGISAESIIQETNKNEILRQRKEKDHILDKRIEYILYTICRLPGGIGMQLLNWLANRQRGAK